MFMTQPGRLQGWKRHRLREQQLGCRSVCRGAVKSDSHMRCRLPQVHAIDFSEWVREFIRDNDKVSTL